MATRPLLSTMTCRTSLRSQRTSCSCRRINFRRHRSYCGHRRRTGRSPRYAFPATGIKMGRQGLGGPSLSCKEPPALLSVSSPIGGLSKIRAGCSGLYLGLMELCVILAGTARPSLIANAAIHGRGRPTSGLMPVGGSLGHHARSVILATNAEGSITAILGHWS
jgi:hypothetical protein